jgi:hypothetical protein
MSIYDVFYCTFRIADFQSQMYMEPKLLETALMKASQAIVSKYMVTIETLEGN